MREREEDKNELVEIKRDHTKLHFFKFLGLI